MSIPMIPFLAILALVIGIGAAYLRLYTIDKEHERMGRILAASLNDASPYPVRDIVTDRDVVSVAPYQTSAEEELIASVR